MRSSAGSGFLGRGVGLSWVEPAADDCGSAKLYYFFAGDENRFACCRMSRFYCRPGGYGKSAETSEF